MRRSDKEITDGILIEEILNEAQICRIAMCDNNLPYIIPMNFGYKAGSLYFHSAKEGKKIHILKENPSVCFEAETKVEIKTGDNACSWGMRYLSIIGQGKVSFLEDHFEKINALDLIMAKYTGEQKFEYLASSINEITLFKIEIQEITGKKSGY